jgi:hypothetical protein
MAHQVLENGEIFIAYCLTLKEKFHDKSLSDRFNECVEDYFQFQVTKSAPAWHDLKEAGNAALKAGNNEGAIKFYLDAYSMTSDMYYGLRILKKGFIQNNENTSRRCVMEIDDLVLYISQYLDAPPHEICLAEDLKVQQPNLPAAICLANIAI